MWQAKAKKKLLMFFTELELKPTLDNDFFVKESRDMITIVLSMMTKGN